MEDNIQKVLSFYDVGEFKSAQRVECGFVNDNWVIETTRGTYFLKRRNPVLRNPDVIRFQHRLLKHLRLSGFPSPDILSTIIGETFLTHDGECYEIQEYIEGATCEQMSQAHRHAAALTLAHYHACVQKFSVQPLCDPADLYHPAILIKNLTRLTGAWELEKDPDLAKTVSGIQSHAAELEDCFAQHERLPYLVIHGDYHAGNLLFKGDRVVGVVDYDKACWQPRVVELAEALIYFASPCPGHLEHLVYPGFIEWDKFTTFLRYYSYGASLDGKDPMRLVRLPQLELGGQSADLSKDTFLIEKEVCALPDYICCIWLSVSLERLIEKDPCQAEASTALREVLDLGDWFAANRQRMIGTIRTVIETATDPSVEVYS